DYLTPLEDAGGGRHREPRDRRQDPPLGPTPTGACGGRGLDRKPTGALGAPVRCRRGIPGGAEGETVSDEPGYVVRIERRFAASAADVFDAWTSPEVMRRWFHCAPDWSTPEAEVDLCVGGKVRVLMRRPD